MPHVGFLALASGSGSSQGARQQQLQHALTGETVDLCDRLLEDGQAFWASQEQICPGLLSGRARRRRAPEEWLAELVGGWVAKVV